MSSAESFDIARAIADRAAAQAQADGRAAPWEEFHHHLTIAAEIAATMDVGRCGAAVLNAKRLFGELVIEARRRRTGYAGRPGGEGTCAARVPPVETSDGNRAALERGLGDLVRETFGPRADAVLGGRPFRDIGATTAQMHGLVIAAENKYAVAWPGPSTPPTFAHLVAGIEGALTARQTAKGGVEAL